MTKNTRLRLLAAQHVEQLLDFDTALAATREAFVLHSEGSGRVFPLVREKLAGGTFGIKSGCVEAQDLLGFKAAGSWPGNRALGSEAHQATILLFDPASGRPRCVIDGNLITTLRTGAAGGLGLLQLARPESTRVSVFGTGVQGQIQTRFALRLLPGLKSLRYASSRGGTDAGFEAAIAAEARGHVDVAPMTDRDAAVADSDIVITTTPGKGPLFSCDAVSPGTHLSCVGTDSAGKRELPEGLLARCRIFVDDAVQTRTIGELQWAKGDAAPPCTTFGDLLTGKAAYSRQADDITLFDMTGIALQDLTVAGLLWRRAEAENIGTLVDWPW